jgi:hypothetical protein
LAARDAMSFSVHGTRDFVGMRARFALAAGGALTQGSGMVTPRAPDPGLAATRVGAAIVLLRAAVLAWREGRRRAPVTQRPL